MPYPYGGETPALQQDGRFTVEPPDNTSTTAPVESGDILKLAIAADAATDGSGYKLVPCVAGDDPLDSYLVQALHRHTSMEQMGVIWLSGKAGMVRILAYDGAAPTVGQSIEIATGNVKKVTGVTHAIGKGLITKVDTVTLTVEVIL